MVHALLVNDNFVAVCFQTSLSTNKLQFLVQILFCNCNVLPAGSSTHMTSSWNDGERAKNRCAERSLCWSRSWRRQKRRGTTQQNSFLKPKSRCRTTKKSPKKQSRYIFANACCMLGLGNRPSFADGNFDCAHRQYCGTPLQALTLLRLFTPSHTRPNNARPRKKRQLR